MERRAVAIRGTVQGIGFRPYIYGLARQLDLRGFVQNRTGGVQIEIEGDASQLDAFLNEMHTKPPPLARIDQLTWHREPTVGEPDFRIHESHADSGHVIVTPDIATCDACLAELFDPRDRRFRYPFLNCTHCGPRLTIQTASPYDRHRTTMARFTMCPYCRAEYDDPTNRRFHAQPIACPACGPQLSALDRDGAVISSEDPIALCAKILNAGKIAAIKGLGGYHLACDARSSSAIQRLRERKHREEKPFAIMVETVAAARELCDVNPQEAEVLASRQRPIVLLRKNPAIDLATEVAPGNPFVGVMLPYTPLHHLILREMNGRLLVMTSGNRADEPIAIDERDATTRLKGIADVFINHDRPIHIRCDDSVMRVIAGREAPMRRSRGYAPQPQILPMQCANPILAVGGQLKNTFAVGVADCAIISHHIGDLAEFEACNAFERDIALYERLFAASPSCIAHDLHPDYFSTIYARRRADRDSLTTVAVQHHHAHIASCMAEHGLRDRVIGVAFDGTGYGEDGAIWGGEFLLADYSQFHRAAHFRYLPMPGGERAIREPWRMAAAHLIDAGVDTSLLRQIPESSLRTIRTMLEKRLNSPLTSSVGRLFDAVAAMLAVRGKVTYEGQAAMELEWLATSVTSDRAYPFSITVHEKTLVIDTREIIQSIAKEFRNNVEIARIARRFHSSIVNIICDICRRIRDTEHLSAVVLSGGVFMNGLLSEESASRLSAEGFTVYQHQSFPANDGGISLGQLAIAATRLGG